MKRLAMTIMLQALVLSGCTRLIHELKTDPAIVGITGFWFQVGLDATPTTGGIPLPSLKFGHGTIWRVGTSNKVTIIVGETAASPSSSGVAGAAMPSGQASLVITTEDTDKALTAQNCAQDKTVTTLKGP